MKKMIIITVTLLLGVGFLSFFELVKPSTAKPTNHKFITFGKVDFSDDDSDNDYDSDDDSDSDDSDENTSWFENFIENHKTPFSKTIQK
ncbi:hypothetical protein [Streptococcus sciuri]|uniref:Uncharacterized protein n=1 Tax=Streptococcus sciuri TaxID=2973939 RepID=A0ABT2F6T9_9STRE|nr:hypothetical protein [Streptococcus sciuri]MCS4487903.1 hypothetical protein [Streptococcus sciuri]